MSRRSSPGNRWLGWAARLRRRYGLERARGGAPVMTLLGPRPPVIAASRHWTFLERVLHPHVRLSLRVGGTGLLRHEVHRSWRVRTEHVALPMPAAVPAAPAPRWLQPPAVVRREPAGAVVRQILNRLERVEHRVASTRMIVVREGATASAAAAQTAGAIPAAVFGSPPAVPARANWAAAPAAPPAFPLEQIADQVLRRLDHRVHAWRERRGRA